MDGRVPDRVPLSVPLRRWLFRTDEPSVRYRVLRELLDRPEGDREVAAARREIGRTGWAAELLAGQLSGGQWATPRSTARDMEGPKYIATRYVLHVLADLGMDRSDARVARAAGLYFDRVSGPRFNEMGGKDSEVCCTGGDARIATRLGFGHDPRVERSLAWLIAAQKKDGGWHCWPSKTGTLDSWQALAAFATVPEERRSPEMARAVHRGLEFYLDRELMHEDHATYAPWLRLHFPVHYYYDVLVGLDIATSLGKGGDPRLTKALDWLERRRNPDGSWNLDIVHPDLEDDEYLEGMGTPFFSLGLEFPGRPSRWITVTALKVLHRAGRI
jgi:Prenyltransferase and squalene oxidase repeat